MQLLRSLQLDVLVEPSAYHEPDQPQLTPPELALEHAKNKCAAVAPRFRDELVVAADTVVDVDGIVFNKPKDDTDAKRMLGVLSGRSHVVHTAFALAHPSIALTTAVESAQVTFFELAPKEIDAYVATGEPLDKAGAYGIQGYGATLVERIDGDFYTVMGFPLGRFVRTLRRLGFEVPIKKE